MLHIEDGSEIVEHMLKTITLGFASSHKFFEKLMIFLKFYPNIHTLLYSSSTKTIRKSTLA